jgi:hypothetical protein
MGGFLRNNLNRRPSAKELQLDSEFAKIVLVYGLMALRWDIDRRDLICASRGSDLSNADPSAPEVSKDGVKNCVFCAMRMALTRSSHTECAICIEP